MFKVIGLFIFSLMMAAVVILVKTAFLLFLWNLFVTEVFGVGSISTPQALLIVLLGGLLVSNVQIKS